MDFFTAMVERHSVRSYTTQPITDPVKSQLQTFLKQCNQESGLHMQLILDEPQAFDGLLARYGNFKNVRNYIALVGRKSDRLGEQCGYYGEKLVLFAQTLGLRTCWVGASYRKRKAAFQLEDGEKCCLVIAIGYGAEDGVPHHSKSLESVIRIKDEMPHWFEKGVQAALLAPTAVNQQKFLFTLVNDHTVRAGAGWGLYTEVDLGIVKYHFELAAGDHFEWAES